MNRRALLLSGLAATLVTVPVLAQTGGSPSTAQPGGTGGASGMNRMGGQMDQAEMHHMEQTMQLGMVALETSRIAQDKASNEDLKRFATFEVQEQTTLAEVLRSMMDPSATAATGQSGAAMQGDVQMDAGGRDMLQTLQSQQAGDAFDKAYLDGQLQGHRNLLQVQEEYLQSNPQNREHMNVARMARTQIREHIALLESIQQTMRWGIRPAETEGPLHLSWSGRGRGAVSGGTGSKHLPQGLVAGVRRSTSALLDRTVFPAAFLNSSALQPFLSNPCEKKDSVVMERKRDANRGPKPNRATSMFCGKSASRKKAAPDCRTAWPRPSPASAAAWCSSICIWSWSEAGHSSMPD